MPCEVNTEGKATMSDAPILPQEIVTDVLTRLPVKSLCRFKCVSHSWHSIISDSHFAQTHLTRNNTTTMPDHRLILIADYDSYALCSVDYSTGVPAVTMLDFPSLQFLSIDAWVEILGSCNGLLLAINEANEGKYLLNPTTRESKKLPKSRFALDSICPYHLYGLGYDSSTDDYKIVMLSFYDRTSYEQSEGTSTDTNTNVSVYSLKANCWRSIQGCSYIHIPGGRPGVYVNGGLHWIASRGSDYFPAIVAFDLANESFWEVPLPPPVENEFLMWCSLAVLGGCLCFIFPNNIQIDIWMMKEYGVKESWTKFTIYKQNVSRMELVCSLEDGEFLLAMDEKKLVVYNPKGGAMRDMVVCGIPTGFKVGGTYVESLVSPKCGQCEAPGKRINRILRGMVKVDKSWTEQSSTNEESYTLEPSSGSENIKASDSTLISIEIDDSFSLSRCLDLLKSVQIVEGPLYEEALRIFEDPHWRKVFIKMACKKKRF